MHLSVSSQPLLPCLASTFGGFLNTSLQTNYLGPQTLNGHLNETRCFQVGAEQDGISHLLGSVLRPIVPKNAMMGDIK